jgi:hypothetical protein
MATWCPWTVTCVACEASLALRRAVSDLEERQRTLEEGLYEVQASAEEAHASIEGLRLQHYLASSSTQVPPHVRTYNLRRTARRTVAHALQVLGAITGDVEDRVA